MDAEWSVEAGLEDPVMVVPWSDERSPATAYVDLKADVGAIDQIAEARAWPEVRHALLLLNAAGSGVWTAKCDAWVLDEDERQLDFGPVAYGFGMYVDILPSSPLVFSSLQAQRSMVETLVKNLRQISAENARADFVIRPALWNEKAGFARTLYVFGYGEQPAEARERWAEAAHAVVSLIASDLASHPGRYNSYAGE